LNVIFPNRAGQPCRFVSLSGMEEASYEKSSPLAPNKTLPSADCRSTENGRIETSRDFRATRDMGGELTMK
jgi:hypothetical protein